MSKKIQLLLVPILVCFFLFGYHYFFNSHRDKIGYVNNVALYNAFNYTKELQEVSNSRLQPLLLKRDSLIDVYEIATPKQKEDLKNVLSALEAQVRTLESEFSVKGTQHIWSRLNAYIQEYGRLHGYSLIIGTQGNGTVMYGTEGLDLTAQVIAYTNAKYEGL